MPVLSFRGAATRAALVAIALVLAGCESPEERAQKHFERGQALVAEGEHSKARIEFRNALRLEANFAEARFELAKSFEHDGNMRSAAANYVQAAALDPQNHEARLRLARFYLVGGASERAQEVIDEALALKPDDPETMAVKSATLYRLGETEAGREMARSVLALDPENMEANLLLMVEQVAQGEADAALARADELLVVAPANPAMNLFKLRVLGQKGDEKAVEAQLRSMVELFPEDVSLRQGLAGLYNARGDFDAAEAELRAVADARPDDAEAALAVVRHLNQVKGPEAAAEELRRLVAAAPDGAASYRMALAQIEFTAGRVDAARAVLEEAVAAAAEAAPAEADRARLQLARMDIAEDDRASARAIVDEVLARDDTNVDALEIRASLRLEDYEIDDAILDLRRALNLDPQNVRLLLLESDAHQRAGNRGLSLDRLAAAARASGFEPEVAIRYASRLLNENQNSAAETALSEAAQRHPQSRQVLGALAQTRLQGGDLSGAEQIAAQLRNLEGGQALAEQITAVVLAQRGRGAESLQVLETLVNDPQATDSALTSLVGGYLRSGEIDRARSLLETRLAENPTDSRALLLMAELSLAAQDPAASEDYLNRAIEAAPQDPIGYAALVRFHLQQGRQEEALAAARRGAEVEPTSLLFGPLISADLESAGRFDEAIALNETLYRGNPGSVVIANNLASLISEHRPDDAEAMAFAARIARTLRDSTVPYFQDTYGWISFLQGDMEEARRALEAAATQLPGNALVRYHLGRLYAQTDQLADARSELEAALAIDAGFPKAASARAVLATLPRSDG